MNTLHCPHQPSCPGCPRLHQAGLPPEPLERLLALSTSAGIPQPIVHSSEPTGFRHRARLAIRGRADAPKLGIFAQGTHQVVHIPSCLVHHPLVNRVAKAVRDCLARQRIATYSDAAHAGIARYLQVVVERRSQRAQVVLVTNGTEPIGLSALFADLEATLGDDLHSLWWNGNPARTNTILGPHFQLFRGEPYVVDSAGEAQIFYPPGAFGQSNLELAMQLAERARQLVQPGRRVTELYAGVGAIGLGLAADAQTLHLNELSESSLEGLRHGVAALPEPVRARTQVHPGPAAHSAGLIAQSDVVIVDPPRKGLEPELRRALTAAPPERLVYVSCDIDSFERDLAELLGSLRLTRLEAFDLFPHTPHLETLALLERA